MLEQGGDVLARRNRDRDRGEESLPRSQPDFVAGDVDRVRADRLRLIALRALDRGGHAAAGDERVADARDQHGVADAVAVDRAARAAAVAFPRHAPLADRSRPGAREAIAAMRADPAAADSREIGGTV